MGCSLNPIQITENDSNTSDISQDLQEVEVSIHSIHEGIQCLKINIEQKKLNYPDDILNNEVLDQFKTNLSFLELSVQSDRPNKKSCLKQFSNSSSSLSKYSPQKKVHFNVIQSQFSKNKKSKKKKTRIIPHKKSIDLEKIF